MKRTHSKNVLLNRQDILVQYSEDKILGNINPLANHPVHFQFVPSSFPVHTNIIVITLGPIMFQKKQNILSNYWNELNTPKTKYRSYKFGFPEFNVLWLLTSTTFYYVKVWSHWAKVRGYVQGIFKVARACAHSTECSI